MVVCCPQHLNEQVACAVHRMLLKRALRAARQHDDDLRTVGSSQSSGQRIDEVSGRPVLVLHKMVWRAAAMAASLSASTSRISLRRFTSGKVRAISTSKLRRVGSCLLSHVTCLASTGAND
jgi:hypothetical protein